MARKPRSRKARQTKDGTPSKRTRSTRKSAKPTASSQTAVAEAPKNTETPSEDSIAIAAEATSDDVTAAKPKARKPRKRSTPRKRRATRKTNKDDVKDVVDAKLDMITEAISDCSHTELELGTFGQTAVAVAEPETATADDPLDIEAELGAESESEIDTSMEIESEQAFAEADADVLARESAASNAITYGADVEIRGAEKANRNSPGADQVLDQVHSAASDTDSAGADGDSADAQELESVAPRDDWAAFASAQAEEAFVEDVAGIATETELLVDDVVEANAEVANANIEESHVGQMADECDSKETQSSVTAENSLVTEDSVVTGDVSEAENSVEVEFLPEVENPAQADRSNEADCSLEHDQPVQAEAAPPTNADNDAGAQADARDTTLETRPEVPPHVVVSAINANSQVLEEVVMQMASLHESIATINAAFSANGQESPRPQIATQQSDDGYFDGDGVAESSELEELRSEAESLRQKLAHAVQQNEELEARVADAENCESTTVAAPAQSEALTWDQRKEMILQQMEDDSFDAESFVANLVVATDTVSEDLDPAEYVNDLNAELERRIEEASKQEKEIQELRAQLEQVQDRAESEDTSLDFNGADGLADLSAADQMVREERESIRQMQLEWEERFRESEIAASIERAKLSRERRELSRKNAELEEQLIHFRRESEESRRAGVGSSRRWLAKLGLTDNDE